MSRANEIPKQDGVALDNSPVANSRSDGARGGTSREGASREMDRFRGPAAYTKRKLIGRRSKVQAPPVDEVGG